jgi:lipopolysaccharide exporter
MSSPTLGLGRKMATGAAWMILMTFVERGVGFVSMLLLARFLVPADFGLVAMAMLVLEFLEVIGSFSFDMAIIQNQRAERRHFDTAWTLTLIYGVVTAFALVVLAVPASHFFREPRLDAIFYAIAGGALLQGFENIGIIAFQKDLDFRKEFNFRILRKLLGFIVTVVLVYLIRNYWALVIGTVMSRLAGVLLSYKLHPYRPRLSLASIGELWRFSGWLLLNNIVVFAAVRGYSFIIGRMAGARALGLYSLAYEISNLPTTELVHPVSRAIFPGFSMLAGDHRQLRQALVQSASLIALVTIPLGAGIAILAEPAVRLTLGIKWLDAIPVIKVLAVYGILRTAHAGTGAAYIAVGAQRAIALINLPHVLVGWPLMILLVPRLGLIGATYAVIGASMVGLMVNFALARRLLGLTIKNVSDCFWRPLVAVLAMSAVETLLLAFWPPVPDIPTLLLQTLLYVGVGATAFVSAVLSLWAVAGRPDGAEQLILTSLARR